jgi:hypothetical protein
MNMISEQTWELDEDIEVPASALIRVERERGYGSVPGLDDAELADPDELEELVFLQEWGPILALPGQPQWQGPRPIRDELGHLDWGAFGTVDFLRDRPAFDKARYKVDKLRERLRDDLIMLDLMREHVSPEARGRVRSVALHSAVELGDIEHPAERAYAKWLRRVQELVQQIRDLQAWRRERWLSRPNAGLWG